jgi:hypothetical protein
MSINPSLENTEKVGSYVGRAGLGAAGALVWLALGLGAVVSASGAGRGSEPLPVRRAEYARDRQVAVARLREGLHAQRGLQKPQRCRPLLQQAEHRC